MGILKILVIFLSFSLSKFFLASNKSKLSFAETPLVAKKVQEIDFTKGTLQKCFICGYEFFFLKPAQEQQHKIKAVFLKRHQLRVSDSFFRRYEA